MDTGVGMNDRNWVLSLATVGLLSVASNGAYAAVEDLSSDNGSYLTAQNVDPFGDEDVINVFGFRGSVLGDLIVDNNDADYYSFTVADNTRITLSVSAPEGPQFGDDPMVGLFDPNGDILTFDDDGGPGFDAFLTFDLLAGGTYFAAVTGYADFDFDGGDSDSTDFLYQLQIKASPIPLPAPIALLGAGVVMLAGRRRSAR
jgi:hypothetical protein